MQRRSCAAYNPLCVTFVFMFGTLVGILAGHTNVKELFMTRHAVVVSVATLVFYLTQVGFKLDRLIFAKFSNKVIK